MRQECMDWFNSLGTGTQIKSSAIFNKKEEIDPGSLGKTYSGCNFQILEDR